jgi:hypothetical protein
MYNINQKKKKKFFLEKQFNRKYYLQVLGPHILKTILLSHLPQKFKPSRKELTKS